MQKPTPMICEESVRQEVIRSSGFLTTKEELSKADVVFKAQRHEQALSKIWMNLAETGPGRRQAAVCPEII